MWANVTSLYCAANILSSTCRQFLVPRYGLRTDAKLKSIPNTSDLKALLEVCWQEDGLFRSGRERLQLVMIVLIVLYSASRPGEIAPNANYFEQEDTMQWRVRYITSAAHTVG